MEKKFTNMRGLVKGFANTLNLLRPEVPNHHQQVAYMSYLIAKEMGYSEADRMTLILASILYDAGLSLLPDFDKEGKRISYKPEELYEAGFSLIGENPRFTFTSSVMKAGVLSAEEAEENDEVKKAYILSKVIYLSSVVSEKLDYSKSALNQAADICEDIADMAGDEFPDEVVEAFLRVTQKDHIWLNLMHRPDSVLDLLEDSNNVTLDEAIEYGKVVSRIIDYRSSYTVMHTAGVVVCAVRLAELMGMSEEECKLIMIAAYLHDIGKLTIPKAILDKNDKLSDEEYNIVKEHAYYTYLFLKDIPGFDNISKWASLHHEKLNGNGYPFGLKADDIPMGARIMAVADIFSAVAEIRPYRAGMSKEQVAEVLLEGAQSGALSRYIVELLITNYDDIYEKRDKEVRNEGARYYAAVVNSPD